MSVLPNIIHVGYHKTATNWFQRIYYPRVRNFTYVDRKLVRSAFLDDSAFKFRRQHAEECLRRGGATVLEGLILCEENLSGHIHSGGLSGFLSKEMACRLHETLPHSRIIIFIRNQVDMLASVYRQYVKEGGTHSVSRYLFPLRYVKRAGFDHWKAAFFSLDHFEYHHLVNHYQEIFGADKVDVYLYEQFAEDGKRFIERFGDFYGFDVEVDRLPHLRVNTSYRPFVLCTARFMNRFTYRDVVDKRYWLNVPLMYKWGKRALTSLNALPLPGAAAQSERILGERNSRFIREYFAESNARLARRCALPLERYGYPMPAELRSEATAEPIRT